MEILFLATQKTENYIIIENNFFLMKVFDYFYEVVHEKKSIEETHRKYARIIFSNNFFKRFQDIEGYNSNILGIPLHIWVKYKSDEKSITIEEYEAEFVRCVGKERFEQEFQQFPEEFERSFGIILDYIYDAEKEYYSGFIGMIRGIFRKKKNFHETKELKIKLLDPL